MRKFVFCFLLIIISLNSNFAQGNYRLEHHGNRSILLSGNVTGSVDDLGLTFYNPARLALIENPAFSISGKAYELNRTNVDDAFGKGNDVSSSSFNGIPSMIAGVFRFKELPKDIFAYSFISRTRTNINLAYDSGVIRGNVLSSIQDVEQLLGRVNLSDKINDEWIGLTWARRINPNFSVGISGFFSIFEFSGRGNSLYAIDTSNNQVVTYARNFNYEQNTYGLFFKIGGAYKINNLELGINIHLPFINIYNEAAFKGDEFLSGSDSDFFRFNEFKDLDNKRRTAFGVSIGSGVALGKSKLHFNLEWFNGVNNYQRISLPEIVDDPDVNEIEFAEALDAVFNFGVGAEIYLNPKLDFYASFSSDFSAYRENANLFDVINESEQEIDYDLDFWHLGLGINADIKWAQFILGATYSRASTQFVQPLVIPSQSTLGIENTNDITSLQIERWRFIIGLEIPFLERKVYELKDKILD